MRALALFVLLPCASCTVDTELSVSTEPELESETRRAVAAWNEALAEGPCFGVRLALVTSRRADIVIRWGDADGYIASTESRRIEMNPHLGFPRYPNYRTVTLAHELGHALGAVDLWDEAAKEDLMWHAPRPTQTERPNAYDVAQVCHYYEKIGFF